MGDVSLHRVVLSLDRITVSRHSVVKNCTNCWDFGGNSTLLGTLVFLQKAQGNLAHGFLGLDSSVLLTDEAV